MFQIGSKIDSGVVSFAANADFHKNELRKLSALEEEVKLGGGKKNIERQHQKGKLTAREPITLHLDQDSSFDEIGLFAANDMYAEEGGAASAGVVVGIGRVSGKLCIIVANDATVKAGAWFPMTCKKNLRAQEISIENHL